MSNPKIAEAGITVGIPAAVAKRQEEGSVQTNEVRDLARSLLNPEYLENLRIRLLSGLAAPGVEVMVWRYAFGDPKTDVNERAHEVARFEAIREAVRARIRAGAGLKDAQAQGARRILHLSPQPTDPELDPDGPD